MSLNRLDYRTDKEYEAAIRRFDETNRKIEEQKKSKAFTSFFALTLLSGNWDFQSQEYEDSRIEVYGDGDEVCDVKVNVNYHTDKEILRKQLHRAVDEAINELE